MSERSQLGRGLMPDFIEVGRHYSRAPIQEAILELRLDAGSAAVLSDLENWIASLDGWEPAERVVEVKDEITMTGDEVTGSPSGTPIGFRVRRSNGRHVFQAQLDRFSFSWLEPYEHWDSFIAEGRALWEQYLNVTNSPRVSGLGVRFINRIDVPSNRVELKDYLRTSIDVSPYLPQLVSGLFFQVSIPIDDTPTVSTITSTLALPNSENTTSMILDIDVRRDLELVPNSPNFGEQLNQSLVDLRYAKNYVFEACITDATRWVIN